MTRQKQSDNYHEGSQSLKGLSISSPEIRMEMENKKEETNPKD